MTSVRWLLLAALSAAGCAKSREDAAPLLKARAPIPEGKTYRLDRAAPGGAIHDGDTIRLAGLSQTVRLYGVDAEEVFKGAREEEEARRDFASFAARMRGDSRRPTKYGTPAGLAAKAFAERFFEGIDEAVLVVDDPRQPTEYYGRLLAHLLVRRGDGEPVNYAVELVRAGHSPYFVKYGTSKLFHAEFVEAEREARAARRGIWNGGPAHYPDYAERLDWWSRRARAIARFEREFAGRADVFQLGYDAELDRLRERVRREPGALVTLFGTLSDRVEDEGGGVVAFFSHRNRADVPVRFPSRADWDRLGAAKWQEECVYVRGRAWPASGGAKVELRVDASTRFSEAPDEDR